MKNLFMAIAVATLGMSNVEASGADFRQESTQEGSISAGRLAEMGLGGMSILSNHQGLEIRGKGFVLVYGSSFVSGRAPKSYFRSSSNFVRGRSSSFVRRGNSTFRIRGGSSGYSFAYAR